MPKALAPWPQWDLSSQIWRLNSWEASLWISFGRLFFYHHLIISSHFLLPVLPNFPVNFLLNISDIAQLWGFLPTPYLVCRVQAKEAMQWHESTWRHDVETWRGDVTWRRDVETWRGDVYSTVSCGFSSRPTGFNGFNFGFNSPCEAYKKIVLEPPARIINQMNVSACSLLLTTPYHSLPLLTTPYHSLPPGLLEGRAWLAQGSCASTEDVQPTKELNTLGSNSNSQWMERTRDFWELLSQDGHQSDSSSFTATLWNPKFAAVHSAKSFVANLTFAVDQTWSGDSPHGGSAWCISFLRVVHKNMVRAHFWNFRIRGLEWICLILGYLWNPTNI